MDEAKQRSLDLNMSAAEREVECRKLFPTFELVTRAGGPSQTREGEPITVLPCVYWKAFGWMGGTLQQWAKSVDVEDGQMEKVRGQMLLLALATFRKLLSEHHVRPATKADLGHKETP